MASLTYGRDGFRLFVVIGARRPVIYLGSISKSKAETVKRHVESLATSQRYGLGIDHATAAWCDSLDDTLHDRISATGLIESRRRELLGKFLREYAAGREVKPSTQISQGQAIRRLTDFYGDDCPLDSIADPHAWLTWLAIDQKYSPATVGRSTAWAKQFFRAAHRAGLITIDPFAGIKAKMQVNADRLTFVDRSTIDRLLSVTTNAEWRTIIALARYGGLRTPSETLGLTWGDIHADRFWVTSPKTEHHPNGAGRWVPLFPELRPFVSARGKSADYLIQHNRTVANWRTQMTRLIKRAKLVAWPRLFQNLRASRETELAAEYPLHVAAAWIGNGALVAARHYLTVREEDMARAAHAQSHAASPRKRPTACDSAWEPSKKTRMSSEKTGEMMGVIGPDPADDPTGESAILSFTHAPTHALTAKWWAGLTVRQQAAIRAVACRKCG
jgi:integrase